MNISINEATKLAEDYVRRSAEAAHDSYKIVEAQTRTCASGWLFFFNSTEFLDTGEPTSALAGNGPIFVSTKGVLKQLSSAIPWENQIDC